MSQPSSVSAEVLLSAGLTCYPACLGGGVQAQDAADDDDSDDDDSTVRSRVDGSPSLKRNELQTYESTNSNAGSLAGGLTIPSAAPRNNDDPGLQSFSDQQLLLGLENLHTNQQSVFM